MEIVEVENRCTLEKISTIKSWMFEKVSKIDKRSRRLINLPREKKQRTTCIRNEGGAITTDTTGIRRITRGYYKQLCAKSSDKLDDGEIFLVRHKITKLNQDYVKNLHSLYFKK